MYKRIEECCKYQGQIKKLTKTKRRKKKVVDVDDECKGRGDESARGAVRRKLTPVKSRCVSEIERIKPSVNVRDQYSFSRHIQCVMDSSAKDSGLSRSFYGISTADRAQKRKARKKPSNKIKPTRMEDTRTRGTHGVRDLDSKNVRSVKFRGNGRKQVAGTEGSTDSDSSSEYDEICSFDSDINLSGVTLTAEDQAAVVENYTKAHTSLTITGNVSKSGVVETA
ncbi:uncharacterized protein LOC107035680 [Diachasma alloeum]|uniref:uncharacterized protein LOC107035680 n=1 Tax=Diachasma alloeum TaxID=454923 RepID=UPI00073839FB|nr:uncharacterized protein LOC107035680 [Diachasma alloeum]